MFHFARFTIILLLVLFSKKHARSQQALIQPEYKIRVRDSSATYLKIINYYDRKVFKYKIFLKKTLADSSFQYRLLKVDTLSGLAQVPTDFEPPYNLQIGKTLEIENIKVQLGKVNQVEIRNEKGFVNILIRPNPSRPKKKLQASLINKKTKDTIRVVNLPCKFLLEQGSYYLSTHSYPSIRYSLKVKPSQISGRYFYTPVPFQLVSKKSNIEFQLYSSRYPNFDVFALEKEGDDQDQISSIDLLPRFLYKLAYRKKGSKRGWKKKKFYISNDVKEFILTID